MKKNLMNEKDFRTIEYKNFDLYQTPTSRKKVKSIKTVKSVKQKSPSRSLKK